MTKELKFEAQTWEIYEREIRETILDEEPASWGRRAVNARLNETYEKLEPYLEAQQKLALQSGYRKALETYEPPNPDLEVIEELKAELGRAREAMEESRARVTELEEEFKSDIRRVHMLRALRDALPAPEEGDLPEPP